MPLGSRIKATFYLPLRDNDGADLGALIATVENECFVAFGGWAWIGEFKGAWRMKTGMRQVDTCAVYSVVFDHEKLSKLEEILLEFKSHTTQEAIYLEIDHHIDVRFL